MELAAAASIQMSRDRRSDAFRIFHDAVDEPRLATAKPGKTDEVDARLGRDAQFVPRHPLIIENGQVEPTEIPSEPRTPNDRPDIRLHQVESSRRPAARVGRSGRIGGVVAWVREGAAAP